MKMMDDDSEVKREEGDKTSQFKSGQLREIIKKARTGRSAIDEGHEMGQETNPTMKTENFETEEQGLLERESKLGRHAPRQLLSQS